MERAESLNQRPLYGRELSPDRELRAVEIRGPTARRSSAVWFEPAAATHDIEGGRFARSPAPLPCRPSLSKARDQVSDHDPKSARFRFAAGLSAGTGRGNNFAHPFPR